MGSTEKVFIKPISKEILIKDSAKEGYLDIYSYDYHADENKRRLGSLYIIGNVSPGADAPTDEEMDVAYMVNLVASLAKREYYSKPNILPKDAFLATLKKINEIVDEFFKNKGTKVNIGIFAVAGEDILISKLGKFKILLNRNNEVLDALNNISVFSKDHVDEKEFSSIISGKVKSGDKILAFYPSRFITSREKYIKDHFLKLGWSEFLDKINEAKEGKQASCAALYIDINKVKESTIVHAPQPKELKPKKMPVTADEATLISADDNPQETSTAIELKKTELPPTQIHESTSEQEPEIPKIIPTEFSSAKKENIFDKFYSILKSLVPKKREPSYGKIGGISWHRKFRKYTIYTVPALVVIVALVWTAKSFIFLSADEKDLRRVSKEIKQNVQLAQSKIDSDDTTGARYLLLSSLLNSSLSSDQKKEMDTLLDKADNAITVDPVLVEELPEEINKKIEQLTAVGENIKSNKYGLSAGATSFDIYQDNLYILSGDKIFKVIDAAKGSETTVSWLKDGVPVPSSGHAIAVDGNIYILSKEGIITKYYRGDKVFEQNTSIFSDKSSLLTAKDIPSLFIVNEVLGRIYVIDKESGAIIKVMRLDNTQPFTASWVDNTGIVYLGSSDGKIWKVQ